MVYYSAAEALLNLLQFRQEGFLETGATQVKSLDGDSCN